MNTKIAHLSAALGICLAVLAPPAYADGISPFAFGIDFHLLIGNAIIGIVEALICAKLFKTRLWRTIGWVIAANYASTFAVVLLLIKLPGSVRDQFKFGLQEYYWATAVFITVLFLLTLIIEWPFFCMAFDKSAQQIKNSWKACLIAQILSYTILVGWYSMFDHTELLEALTDHIDLTPASIASIYFIGEDGRGIYKLTPDTRKIEKLADGDFKGLTLACHRHPGKTIGDVYVTKHPLKEPFWAKDTGTPPPGHPAGLAWYAMSGNARPNKIIDPDIPLSVTQADRCDEIPVGGKDNCLDGRPDVEPGEEYWVAWASSFGTIASDESPEGPTIIEFFKYDNFAHQRTDTFHLELHTLLSNVAYTCVTMLPGQLAICGVAPADFGKHQIITVDPNNRKVAVLADGRQPLVILRSNFVPKQTMQTKTETH